MKTLLIVGIGGAAGSILRFLMQRWFNESYFPFGTLLVNISGCLFIGIFAGLSFKYGLSQYLVLLGMIGFCGGFTTFSAFSLESLRLLQENRMALFFIYAGCTMLLSLLATFVGYKMAS